MRYTWLGVGRLKIAGVGLVESGQSFDSTETLTIPGLSATVEPSPDPVPVESVEPPPQGRKKRR